MGVFYEFTFALILIDYFFLFYNPFQLKDYLKKRRASTNADPSFQQQKLIV